MKTVGRHLLIEYYGCNPRVLNDLERIKDFMLQAATESGATVIESFFHRFSPLGVSGVVMIAESHFAIHTWPEHKYASADIFICGTKVDPWAAFHCLRTKLGAKEYDVREILRGEIARSQRRTSRRSC